MKVLNFGSLNLDYVYQVDHFVKPGETLNVARQVISPGGKGLNQSIALARAGMETYHAGCLGKGGEMLEEILNEAGVNTSYLHKVEEYQGNALIQVDPSGENSILLYGGSNQCITEEQIQETMSHFEAGDYLILQNEVNHLDKIVEAGAARGMILVLNPSPFDSRLDAVDFGKISWLVVNEIEVEQITGHQDPDAAWQMIREKYPNTSLVVTLGKEGSRLYRGDVRVDQPIYPVKAVDTTGAGDTFLGYFTAGLMEGKTYQASMDQASKASSITVTRLGAAPAIPMRKDVLGE